MLKKKKKKSQTKKTKKKQIKHYQHSKVSELNQCQCQTMIVSDNARIHVMSETYNVRVRYVQDLVHVRVK